MNLVFPYGVAFKLVAILGLVTLPVCCWAFGRLARFRYPMPELMAVAATIFLFDESFSIYGGNVKSTMAGEFSFSIALSFAILGLGLFARGLETGKFRTWAAVLIALAMLCHGIVLLFVVLGALLLWAIWMDRTRFIYGLTVLVGAVLLSAFWVVPFLANHAYMTDMKYHGRPDGPTDSYWDMFFPWTTFLDIVVTGFAIFGFIASVIRRHLVGAWLGICCLALTAFVVPCQELAAGHRSAVEPTPASVPLPLAFDVDDGRHRRVRRGRRARQSRTRGRATTCGRSGRRRRAWSVSSCS